MLWWQLYDETKKRQGVRYDEDDSRNYDPNTFQQAINIQLQFSSSLSRIKSINNNNNKRQFVVELSGHIAVPLLIGTLINNNNNNSHICKAPYSKLQRR